MLPCRFSQVAIKCRYWDASVVKSTLLPSDPEFKIIIRTLCKRKTRHQVDSTILGHVKLKIYTLRLENHNKRQLSALLLENVVIVFIHCWSWSNIVWYVQQQKLKE